MLPILLAVCIWLPALIGLGSPLVKALRRATGAIVSNVSIRAAIAGLLGMFTAGVVTAAANFFVPAYPAVSTALLISGWLLLLKDRHRWLRLPRRAWRLVAFTVLFVALADSRGIPWYDTGIYHLQAVKWITSGPLPRGLANLYGSLGYNCSWFALSAAIETPLLLGKSCFVTNALLAILMALPALDAATRGFGGAIRGYRVVLVLMLIPWAHFNIQLVASLAPDPAVILIVLFCLVLWIRSFRFVPYIMVLACFAMTIKLSAAPLFAGALAAMVAWAIKGPRGRARGSWVIAFCAASALVFLARGVWLSGYPAFPSSIGRCNSLSWTATPQNTSRVAGDIESWSKYHRLPQTVVTGTPWIGRWLWKVGLSPPMLLAGVVFIVGIACWLWRRPGWNPAQARSLVAMLALLPGVALWFISAPQPRFGYGYIFGAASALVAAGLCGRVLSRNYCRARCLAKFIGIAALLVLTHIDLRLLKASIFRWPAIATARLATHRTVDGTLIYMPVGDDRVWAAPLPATPELDPRLRCEVDDRKQIRRFWVPRASEK